jgi:uncharacterized protein RhaS with RHS repeats
VTLLHLNGRVYDPYVAKFTSADPIVAAQWNTQGWNRYAYVGNNPLAYTDPTGYDFFSDLFNFLFNPVAQAQFIFSVPFLGQAIQIGTVAYTFTLCGPCSIGVAAGLSSIQAGVEGGSLADAIKAGWHDGRKIRAAPRHRPTRRNTPRRR